MWSRNGEIRLLSLWLAPYGYNVDSSGWCHLLATHFSTELRRR